MINKLRSGSCIAAGAAGPTNHLVCQLVGGACSPAATEFSVLLLLLFFLVVALAVVVAREKEGRRKDWLVGWLVVT